MTTTDVTPLNAAHAAWDLSAYSIEATGEVAQAVMQTRPVCPQCNGSGHARVDVDGSVAMGRCRCLKLPDRIGIFNRAGIPSRYVDTTFVSFAQEPDGQLKELDPSAIRALGQCSQWVQDYRPGMEHRGMVMHGDVGRGKTHLMVAMLRELVFQHGIAVRFVEFSRLLSMLKAGYSAGRSDAELLGELADVPVLAIDELGKGRMTDWELTIIDEVISRRYNAMGCTLATSNYPPGDPTGHEPPNLATQKTSKQTLGDRVGERVYSRLVQLVDFIEVDGKDHRQKG